jgi:hypothetical protein
VSSKARGELGTEWACWGSPTARGWSIAGVQHLYEQSDGSALITDGDGSALYFNCSASGTPCAGSYQPPAGEYSSLTHSPREALHGGDEGALSLDSGAELGVDEAPRDGGCSRRRPARVVVGPIGRPPGPLPR